MNTSHVYFWIRVLPNLSGPAPVKVPGAVLGAAATFFYHTTTYSREQNTDQELIMLLERLPPELAYDILDNKLDIADIKTLRLVNRSYSKRCLTRRFRQSFKPPMITMSEDDLQRLCVFAANPLLRQTTRTLIIIAVVPDVSPAIGAISATRQENQDPDLPEDTMTRAKDNLEWLKARETTQLEILTRAFRTFGRLGEVKLVTANTAMAWHPLWEHVSRVQALTLEAIARSGLLLNRLDLFRDAHRCYPPSADVTRQIEDLQDKSFNLGAAGIRSLALGVSTKVITDPAVTEAARARANGDNRSFLQEICGSEGGFLGRDSHPPNAAHDDNFRGISQLLKFFPDLTTMDLHLYCTIGDGMGQYANILTLIAQDVHLSQLEVCSIAGFPATEEALLQFLQKHTAIKDLTLREIHLQSGSWDPIFAFLSEEMPQLERLHLSNLFGVHEVNGKTQLNLCPTWTWACCADQWSYPGLGVHTRTFGASDLKKGLTFRPPQPGSYSSPWRSEWHKRRGQEFGCEWFIDVSRLIAEATRRRNGSLR